VTEALGSTVQVNSISGGTDVCTAFVGMNPLTPVRAGEISGPLLGCDVAADGGELVIRRPMPSMPVGFWGDDDGSRYRNAYFADRPGVWTHGDWLTVLDGGACVITGRSDATLNRGGVRIGTADLYRVVEELPEVLDSVAVHLEAADELRLFVQLAPGATLGDELRGRIAAALRRELSPRHVPDRIDAVPVVPRTLSGKKLEVPVKRILTGTPADVAASRGSLADPTSLTWFEQEASAKQSGGDRAG
jgi:acetoacetyl-CoA synthetase